MPPETAATASMTPPTLRFGAFELDVPAGRLRRDGQPVDLAPRPFALLVYLSRHAGRLVSKDELLDAVWGYDAMPTTRTVDVHVAWLRQKLEEKPRHPKYIHTVHGMGYKFTA